MAKKQEVADVLVNGEWWNTAMKPLTTPEVKESTTGAMRVRGPLVKEDHHGIWIGDAPSNLIHVKSPKRQVLMRVFIPWRAIITIGGIEDPGVAPGFTAEPSGGQP
jgi:hypothetical protein